MARRTGSGKKGIPLEIRRSLVRSLYEDGVSFSLGAVISSMGALISALRTESTAIYLCSIALLAIASARSVLLGAYWRREDAIDSHRKADRWELYYGIGGVLYVGCLGGWCFLAFYTTDDRFSQIMSLTTAVVYLIGISGRNFGNALLVDAQLAALAAPLMIGLVLANDLTNNILCAFLAPFFLSVRRIAARLRKILLDASTGSLTNRVLAARFDAALNNMPLGLAMFDAAGQRLVLNRRWSDLAAKDAEAPPPGAADLGATVDHLLAGARVEPHESAAFRSTFARPEAMVRPSKIVLRRLEDTLELVVHPAAGGGLIAMLEDVTGTHVAQARISHMATYDGLTGLLNRAAFEERVTARLTGERRDESFAIYFLDLDNFKQVNDTLGHAAGDALLFEVASRLRLSVRESDHLARFGGDEFVILQPGCAGAEEAASLAMRVIQSVSEPYFIDGQHIVVGVSVGVAFAPRDGRDIATLFKRADMALYRAKSDGRGTFHFYEEAMDQKAKARREIETDLRVAVRERSFEAYFQPLYDIKLGRIVTCEALLRWPHPRRGIVSPGEFIPVAEDVGLITAIGEQVIERATRECMGWPDGIAVAVNLSPIQFSRGDIVATIGAALASSGLRPDRLEVEITESVLLHDMNTAIRILGQLHAMGVKIALDDFGTGYSSLSYLQSLPLHKVKIDRAFLRDIEGNERSRLLMAGVARLSAELGLRVTVEGVETYEQLDAISANPHVDEIQGFLFCRPLPPADLRELLGVRKTLRVKAA